jgi:hypothetical protein
MERHIQSSKDPGHYFGEIQTFLAGNRNLPICKNLTFVVENETKFDGK